MTRSRLANLLLIAVAAAAVAVGLAACGDDDSAATIAPDRAPPTMAATTAANLDTPSGLTAAPTTTSAAFQGSGDAEEPDLGSGGVPVTGLQPVDIGRDIIFRADLTVAVDDVEAAGAQAGAIIQGLGGYLFGQQTTGGNSPRSLLTFKVLPVNFQAALDALGGIGEVRSQNVSADDVTESIVDLESQISTAEASVERLRTFLTQATAIEDVIEFERELANRERDLERLRGQLRTLEDLVAFATIILNLTEADISPALEVTISAYPAADDAGESCPGQGEFRYEQDTQITVCLELLNAGDTPLRDFVVRDTALDLDFEDFIVVRGDPTQLEPGQSLVLARVMTVERDMRTQTRITAEPVKVETGEIIPSRTVTRTVAALIAVSEPDEGIGSFTDGLSAGWDVLTAFVKVVVLAFGAVLPFIWVPVIAYLLIVWRRRHPKEETPPAVPPQATPPQEPTEDERVPEPAA